MENRRVLVTGANGFVGQALARRLLDLPSINVIACSRSELRLPDLNCFRVSPELNALSDWRGVLDGADTVIHLAGLAHISTNDSGKAMNVLREVNCNGTLSIARQSSECGVIRFVYISSIGVNGNSNIVPFTPYACPHPVESYAQSKWEAEQGLWQIQQETGMEVVIIRPPLVYGPGAPGNFGSLVRWVEKGVPLPLGAIHNKRSLVGIDNLVDLIIRCIDHPSAANQVFLAGDGEDLSTTELLRAVGKAMGKPARLIPVPAGLLQLGATLLGKKAMAQRLLGSLQVDISKTCELLDWKPPYTVEEGLRRCFEPVK